MMIEDEWERVAGYWRTVALWGWAIALGTLIAAGILAGYLLERLTR